MHTRFSSACDDSSFANGPQMKKKHRFLFFLLCLCQVGIAEEVSSCKEILAYIEQHLPSTGVLLHSSNGFLYVKVDDDYIHKLNDFVKEEGFEEPPYFGQLYTSGAHISVIYPEEIKNNGLISISELGEEICFRVKGCRIEKPPNWKGVEKVCFISVDAPNLEHLREKYGFSPKEFEFHITIGIKKRDNF